MVRSCGKQILFTWVVGLKIKPTFLVIAAAFTSLAFASAHFAETEPPPEELQEETVKSKNGCPPSLLDFMDE